MMGNSHPEDFDLLAYAEGELEPARRSAVEAHLAGCERCAADLRAAEAGHTALVGSGLLELPAERQRAIVAGLPARERKPRSFRWAKPLAILAPVAAVVAIVVTLSTIDGGVGGGDADQAAEGGGAALQESTDEPAAGETGTFAPTVREKQRLLFRGPATALAQTLRDQGFDAEVVDDKVVVHGAQPRAVRRALAGRAKGDVVVKVEP